MKKFIKKVSVLSVIATILALMLVFTSIPSFAIVAGNKTAASTDGGNLDGDINTVVYTGSGTNYGFSPSICVLENGANAGRVLASWDISDKECHVAYSDDGGESFTESTLAFNGCHFATVFEAGNAVYLMARRVADRNLVVLKSTDGGKTFGNANLICTGTWHTSPTGVYYRNGLVYILWETGESGRASLSPVLLWANVNDDLSVESNWKHSTISFPFSNRVGSNSGNGQTGAYINTDYLGSPFLGDVTTNLGWLEGSITEITDSNSPLYDSTGNTLYCYLRSTYANSGFGNLMKFVYNPQNDMWAPQEVKAESGKSMVYTQLPGGQNKFHITLDKQTGLQWLLGSVSTDSLTADSTTLSNKLRKGDPANERKDLGLYYSADGLNWTFAGFVARGATEIESRNYASMYIYGNDLYVLSRSGDTNASTAHNNNLITFHKVANFRALSQKDNIGTSGVVWEKSALAGKEVKDLNTFVDGSGKTWVTCNIGNEGFVLQEDTNGALVQSLSSDLLLSKVAEIDGNLYVFGTDSEKLCVYKYTNGSGWGNYTKIEDGEFASAPSDVFVDGGKVYIAVDQYDAPAEQPVYWSAKSGYTGATGSVTDDGTTAILTGYGYAHYGKSFNLDIGETISTTMQVQSANEAGGSRIGLFFANADTFYSQAVNPNYTASGVAFEIAGNSNQSANFVLRYSKVTDGVLDSQSGGYASLGLAGVDGSGAAVNAQLNAGVYACPLKVSLTKKTATVYTLKVTTTNATYANYVYSADITLDSDIFANGVYLTSGWRYVQNANNTYTLTHPVFAKWASWRNVAITDNGGSVTVDATATGAASSSEFLTIPQDCKVSSDITFNFAGISSTAVAPGLAFTSTKDLYYDWNKANGNYAIGMQFHNSNGIQYFTMNGTTQSFANISSSKVNFNRVANDLTYTVSLTNKTAEGYWLLELKMTAATVYSMQIPTSVIPANAFDNGVYINAGNRVSLSAGAKFTVTDLYSDSKTSIGENDAYYTYPAIYSADVTGFSVASTFTETDGKSFAEKIGNPYEANLGLFGLPAKTVDVNSIGWGKAEFVKLNGSVNTDLRFRGYAATNDASGAGNSVTAGSYESTHSGLMMYMPVKNLGDNYAAMFMVDADGIKDFVAPSGETMILVHLPGGNYSFDIAYDSATGTYWLATTENTDSADKRVALYYSYNAYDWLYVGTVADELTCDAKASLAFDGGDIVITANTDGIKQYRISDFASLIYEGKNSLTKWTNIRGFNNTTMVTTAEGTSFSGIGGAYLNRVIDMSEGSSVAVNIGTDSGNWTAGGKFTVGLVNAANSFVGGGADTGSGFIIDIINNGSIGANAYLYTVTNGTPSGSGAIAENKFNTKTLNEAQITGNGIELVFTRHTHKDANGNDCAFVLSVMQNDGIILQKSLTTAQVPANTFNSGAYLIAGARYGAVCKYTVKSVATYSLFEGDVNADFGVNASDATYMITSLLSDCEYASLDVNKDSFVNILDLVSLKKLIAAQ